MSDTKQMFLACRWLLKNTHTHTLWLWETPSSPHCPFQYHSDGSWHPRTLTSSKEPGCTVAECISHIYSGVTSPPSKRCCSCPNISSVQELWEPSLIGWFPGHPFPSRDSCVHVSPCGRAAPRGSSEFQHSASWPCTCFFLDIWLQPERCRICRVHCWASLVSMASFIGPVSALLIAEHKEGDSLLVRWDLSPHEPHYRRPLTVNPTQD